MKYFWNIGVGINLSLIFVGCFCFFVIFILFNNIVMFFVFSFLVIFSLVCFVYLYCFFNVLKVDFDKRNFIGFFVDCLNKCLEYIKLEICLCFFRLCIKYLCMSLMLYIILLMIFLSCVVFKIRFVLFLYIFFW